MVECVCGCGVVHRERCGPTGRRKKFMVLVDSCSRCRRVYPVCPEELTYQESQWVRRWNKRQQRFAKTGSGEVEMVITEQDVQGITRALISAINWIEKAEFPPGAIFRPDWLTCKERFADGRIQMDLLPWGWFGSRIEIWFSLVEPKEDCSVDEFRDSEIDRLRSIVERFDRRQKVGVLKTEGCIGSSVLFEIEINRGPGITEVLRNSREGCLYCLAHGDNHGGNCTCGWRDKGMSLLTVPEGWGWGEDVEKEAYTV